MSLKRIYNISAGVEIQPERGHQNNPNKSELHTRNVQIGKLFEFHDYDLNSTIAHLKEYYLTTFGQHLKYCKCTLFVYYKVSNIFYLLSSDDNQKLNKSKHDELYLIKINCECKCQFKLYTKYMNMHSFDIIKEFKEKFERMENEIIKLRKEDELKFQNKPLEDFYDIIIDINSVRRVSTEGWKVEFTEKGLEKYNEYKDKDLILIGVIGNNNKGKSFLLSKISKIKLLSGTNIETKGLSVKYPDLKGFAGRQIILLDSAGLETPVLKSKKVMELNKEKIEEENKEKNEIISEKENVQKDEEILIDKIENEDEKEEDDDIEGKKKKKSNQIDEEIKKIKEFRDNSSDKIITELFLQNFIVKNCDILLLVVGKLTYSEQKLIIKIKDECKKQNKSRLFIVHNLQEFRKVEQVQNYIKDTLLNCSTFNLKIRQNITTQKTNDEIKIKHIK